MSREKGVASFSASFETQMALPLDARMIAGAKADLINPTTWTANDGNIYIYKGMFVSVHSDSTIDNNGLYRLKTLPYTNIANWEKIGSGGGGSGTLISTSGEDLSSLYLSLNADNDWGTTDDTTNLRIVSQHSIKQYIASQIVSYLAGNGIDITTGTISTKLSTNSGLSADTNGLSVKFDTNILKSTASGLGFKDGTAIGQVFYWNGTAWIQDTFSNLYTNRYKTDIDVLGDRDGINMDFVINTADTPITATLMVFKSGMRMTKAIDYNYTPGTKTITFLSGVTPPTSNTVITCDFFI